MSAFYAMWHGPIGLQQIAQRVHGFAARLHAATNNREDVVFDTVHIVVEDADVIHKKAAAKGINFAKVSKTEVRVSFDEQTTEELFTKSKEKIRLSEIYSLWQSPPFGLKNVQFKSFIETSPLYLKFTFLICASAYRVNLLMSYEAFA